MARPGQSSRRPSEVADVPLARHAPTLRACKPVSRQTPRPDSLRAHALEEPGECWKLLANSPPRKENKAFPFLPASPCLSLPLPASSLPPPCLYDLIQAINRDRTSSPDASPLTSTVFPVAAGTHPSPSAFASATFAPKPVQCIGITYVGAGTIFDAKNSTVGCILSASSGPARCKPPTIFL